jgi:hypothetical protein
MAGVGPATASARPNDRNAFLTSGPVRVASALLQRTDIDLGATSSEGRVYEYRPRLGSRTMLDLPRGDQPTRIGGGDHLPSVKAASGQ